MALILFLRPGHSGRPAWILHPETHPVVEFDDLGIDASRAVTWGSSAGGHLALMLGLTASVDDLEGDVGGNRDRSSRVQAVPARTTKVGAHR